MSTMEEYNLVGFEYNTYDMYIGGIVYTTPDLEVNRNQCENRYARSIAIENYM